ncbi:MAG: RHS repeat protein [Sphingobacteriaceae bacterium]|nr:RHS repeat protein [Sphingobacteriaceae bacterium]
MFNVLKINLLAIILFASVTAFAQHGMEDYSPVAKQIIPPSPEGATLGKYGTIPISLFEGRMNYDIPIYNLEAGNINIPISVNYSSSGIKVSEIASNVGLGWTLMAGGAITIVVNDKPDLDISYSKNLPINPLTFNPNTEDVNNPDYLFARSYSTQDSLYDTEPDNFYYNFCGISGKFLMNSDRTTFFCNPVNNLKIQYTEVGFVIYDDKGTRYEFFESEITNMTEECVFGATNPRDFRKSAKTTFYLTKIKDSNGIEINLSYEEYPYKYPTGYTEVKYLNTVSGSCGSLSTRDKKCLQYQLVAGARIKQIVSPNANVVFNYDSVPREDLATNSGESGSRRLVSIIVNRLIENNLQETIKLFNFNHDYYRSQAYNSQLTGIEKAVNSRLRLLSIKEQSSPPYIFDYDPKPLPSRLAFGSDFYGYYNGMNNTTGIPRFEGLFNSGADKAVKTEFVDAGILKKITYPTGGSTELVYEPNLYEGNLIRDSLVNKGIDVLSNGSSTTVTGTLVVTNLPSSNVTLQYSIPPSSTRSDATITRPDGTVIRLTESGNISNFLINQIGNYVIRITNRTTDEAYVKIVWVEKIQISYQGISPIAGLRIKKTINKDNNGVIVNSKSYTYLNALGKSSLKMLKGAGRYQDEYKLRKVDGDHTVYVCNYTVLSSSPNAIIGNDGDNQYGYRNVTELDEQTGTQGKKDLVFSLGVLDFLNDYSSINQYDDATTGKILRTENYRYDANTASYKIVDRTVNTYRAYFNPKYFWSPTSEVNPPKQTSLYGLRLKILMPEMPDPNGALLPLPAKYLVETYLKISFFQFLESQDSYSYSADTTQFTKSSVKYYYDNLDHLLNTGIEKRMANGKILVTKKRYPNDMINKGITVPYAAMVLKNMLDPIIEEEILVDGLVLETKRRNYDFGLSTNNDLILLSNIESQFKQDTPEIRSRISNYNQIGNPLCSFKENGLKTVYLYSYKNLFPIAEIKNADYSTVKNILTEGALEAFGNLQSPDRNAIDIFLQPLKVNLPNCPITIYSYKPLVGITSITDPKGQTTYYEYDEFQRLKTVKDQNGNILKQTDYHYKN